MAITTLRIMGRTATAAADTPAFREWASRLATKAPARNYVEQLREIYNGVLARWRYVLESGEWVHGTARSLIAHVLGTKYDQADTRPELADLSRPSPTGKFGFGDCDDVATVVAAAVMAIGQRPLFRISSPPLHVSVVAITPTGKMVSIDPVGHPKHAFGWAAPSRSGQVRYFDMQGNEVGARPWPVQQPFVGIEGNAMHERFGQVEFYDGIDEAPEGTYFMGPDAVPHSRVRYPHLAYVRPEDLRGPRVLAIPHRTMRQFQMGACPDGAAGVDEYGEEYEYDGTRDLWMQRGSEGALAMVHDQNLDEMDDEEFAANFGWGYADREYVEGFGISRRARRRRRRAKRRARRRARRARIRAGARRLFKRIGRGVRKVGAKFLAPILRSKWAQRVIGRGLSAIGIPARLTKMFMAAAGSIIKDVGVVGLIRMIRKDRKKALRILAAAGKAGLKAATRLAGTEDDRRGELLQTWTVQDGVEFPSQQVLGLVAIPDGVYGQADVDVADEPTPGAWYRVHKGDTLLGVTGEAYAIKPSTKELRRERLAKSRWINQAAVNQVYFDPSLADSLYRDGRISFRPRYSCDPAGAIAGESGSCYALIYIPMMKGDEPPAVIEEPPVGPEPELPEVPEEPDPRWAACAAVGGRMIAPETPLHAEPQCVLPDGRTCDAWALVRGEPDACPPVPPPVAPTPVAPLPPVEPPPTVRPPVAPTVTPTEPTPAPTGPDVPEPPAEPTVECPEWFEPSPTDPTVCRPVAAPGGSGCPPGMIWRSVAQGGPPPLGGCVRLLPTPGVPEPPDMPEVPEACPPGYVRSAQTGECIRHLAPTAPPTMPPTAPPTAPPTMPPPPGVPFPQTDAGPIPLGILLFLLMNA